MGKAIFNPPNRWGGMWHFPPYDTITDEEFDLAIGLTMAKWYRQFYELEEEDKQKIIIQGKPLSYWLLKVDEENTKDKGNTK